MGSTLGRAGAEPRRAGGPPPGAGVAAAVGGQVSAGRHEAVSPPAPSGIGSARDYFLLMKPRIVFLLLVTTWAGMVVAGGKIPGAGITLLTMVGGGLSAGAANAFNMYIERDRDRLMERTSRRPLPAGRLSPRNALIFAFTAAAASVIILGFGVNWLAAALATAGLLAYVVLYTWWLKPSSVHNTFFGGIAGAMPPAVGWAAVAGSLDTAALLLFAVIFFWQLPHTWALAVWRLDDYSRAGFPMMPVVAGVESTRRQSMVYTLLMVASSLGLYFTGALGWLYLAAAVALGAGFIAGTVKFMTDDDPRAASGLFKYSTIYLFALYVVMVADALMF